MVHEGSNGMTSAMASNRFLPLFWALARPYWVSERRGKGLVLLAVVVGLALGLVWINVLFNSWYNDFYNALQEKDTEAFWRLIAVFTGLAFASIGVQIYRLYFQQMLQIEWRTWLNERFLGDWLKDRAYYRMQLLESGTDNPDQRIAEDLRLFVDYTLSLGLGFLSAVVTLASFVTILWTLSGAIELAGISIPGYMVWAALLYAIAGTWLTHRIGRPLIGMEFNQQRFEADYRFSLVRLRENSEGVALYRGENEEFGNFRAHFSNVIANWWAIMRKQKQLGFFTVSYAQIAIIFPYVVAAPRYFSGAIQLGGLMQIANSFGQVQSALSWFIDAYPQFATWKATVDRLTGFAQSLEHVRKEARRLDGERVEEDLSAFRMEDLSIKLPQGQSLLAHADLEFARGRNLLISGPSGSGKSTLFRTLAGIWPYWQGRLTVPRGTSMLFLPQKPYLPIGTLKNAVCYPGPAVAVSDQRVVEVLTAVGLGTRSGELSRVENWAQLLSGGEQQRLAFARVLVNQPEWVFLDEATSSLPEPAEANLYQLIGKWLPNTTLVSIGHRESLAKHHAVHLVWRVADGNEPRLAPV